MSYLTWYSSHTQLVKRLIAHHEEIPLAIREIKEQKCSALAFAVAKALGDPTRELAQVIIDNKDPWRAYLYAKTVENAPISNFVEMISASNDALHAYSFMKTFRDVDIASLSEVLLRSKDPYLVFRTAKNIPGAPVEKLMRHCMKLLESEGELSSVQVTSTSTFTAAQWRLLLNRTDQLNHIAQDISLIGAL